MKKKAKQYDKDVLKPSHGFKSLEEEVTYLRQTQVIHREVLDYLKKNNKINYQ